MATPSTDSAAIEATINALLADGWELVAVNDGDDGDIAVVNRAQARRAITAVGMADLYVRKGDETGRVFFVLGNDPEEVINDHTINLSEPLDRLMDSWF